MSDKIITLDNLDTFKTKIESEINDKQDKLPTVVNDRYLHTNSSTGALEWTSVSGGGGTDNIQIVSSLPSTSNAQNNILYKLNNDLYALTETEQVAPVISYSNGTLTVTCDYDAESIELYADNTLIDTIVINGGNS